MPGGGGSRDRSEFERAVEGATPIPDRDKLAEPPKTLRRRRAREDAAGVAFEIDRLGERVEGIAPGGDRSLLRRLRSREYPPDVRIDLHGFDAASARRRVHEALAAARAEGDRCVLVIHGRGRGSEAGPVLKEALLDWIAEPGVAPLVLAFATAAPGDGGVGATYVLLRRERD
jgi:DNA-nicking Smr family endonuclease